MERITFEGLFCDIAQCVGRVGQTGNTSECSDCYCDQRRTWEQLKQYEDTGLTPEQLPKWIPVKERLPEPLQRVIVYMKGVGVEQGRLLLGGDGWWYVLGSDTKDVTHWMPMPEPPKEVTK